MSFNEKATGVYTIAATPFHPDVRLDMEINRFQSHVSLTASSGISTM